MFRVLRVLKKFGLTLVLQDLPPVYPDCLKQALLRVD